MLTIVLGLTMAVLDGAIANVALPTIAIDIHASASASVWVVNAYQLVITVCLLPFASLGERFGYRRVYTAGLVVFTLGSLACALSGTLLSLTAARVFQGFGAAGIMSVNGALVRFIYPRRELGRGIGLNALVVAVSAAAGPTIAAGILSVGRWPWLFAVNVPIGAFAIALALRSLPGSPAARFRFDFFSAALNAFTFGLLIVTIDQIGHSGSWWVETVEFAITLCTGTWLVRRQSQLRAPLLPVDLLAIPVFRLSIMASICSFAAQMLAFVSLPFYFHDTLHLGEVATGLLMTPWPLATAIIAPISGRLADRYASGMLGGIGLGVFCAGLGLLYLLPLHPSEFDIAWRMAICGLGFGLFQSPNNRTLMSAAPRERSGGASGMLATARLLGQTTGAAIVAMLFGIYPSEGHTLPVLVATVSAGFAAGISLLRIRHQPGPAALGR